MTSLLHRLSFLAGRLPFTWLTKLSFLLGTFWFSVLRLRRQTVLNNLKRAFPDWDEAHRKRIAKKSFQHLCATVLEFLAINPQTMPALQERITVQGRERVDEALKRGRGVIVLTGHVGNWDLLACSQAALGYPLTIVSKTIKPKGLNDYWMQTRQACGVTILPDRHVYRDLIQTLSHNGVVGFVADQSISPRRGVFAPFFGVPCASSSAVARLARDSGAAVLPVFLYRETQGRFTMVVDQPLLLQESGSQEEELVLHTTRCNEALERAILRRPEQWLWQHRRWKHQAGDTT